MQSDAIVFGEATDHETQGDVSGQMAGKIATTFNVFWHLHLEIPRYGTVGKTLRQNWNMIQRPHVYARRPLVGYLMYSR